MHLVVLLSGHLRGVVQEHTELWIHLRNLIFQLIQEDLIFLFLFRTAVIFLDLAVDIPVIIVLAEVISLVFVLFLLAQLRQNLHASVSCL